MPRISVTVVAAVVGLVIGSFLNVVVYRVPLGLSVATPGSFCPSCHTPIRAYDNVPVLSWLVLRGRCRRCGNPISVRYPLVELTTGVLFGAIGWGLGAHPSVAGMCALGATAWALAVIEFDGRPPSAGVAIVGTALGGVLLLAATAAGHRWWHVGGEVIGVAVGTLVVLAWHARRRPGDDRIEPPWALLPLGAVVGWVGPVGVAAGLPAAAVVAAWFGWWRARRDHPSAGGEPAPDVTVGGPSAAARSTRGRSVRGLTVRGLSAGAAVGAAAAVIAGLAAGSLVGL